MGGFGSASQRGRGGLLDGLEVARKERQSEMAVPVMEKRGVGFRQEANAEPSRVLFGAHELLRGGDAGRSLTYTCRSAAQQIYKGEHRQRRDGILLKDTPLQEEGCHGVETTIQSIGVKITKLVTTSFNLSALAFMSMSSLVAQMVRNLPVIRW